MAVIGESDVKSVLSGLGYEFDADKGDSALLLFAIAEVTEYICRFCNISAVPDEFENAAAVMAAGKFLKGKYASGRLNIEGLDFSGTVTQVTEGDTTVAMSAEASPEAAFTANIERMINRDAELVTFRKLRW